LEVEGDSSGVLISLEWALRDQNMFKSKLSLDYWESFNVNFTNLACFG
jgi:hypothetical protein